MVDPSAKGMATKCGGIEELLYSKALNENSDIDEFRLRSHLAGCEPCRDAGNSLIALVKRIKQETGYPLVAQGFRQRLGQATLLEIGVRRSRVLRNRMLVAGSALAAACICVMITMHDRVGQNEDVARLESSTAIKRLWTIENVSTFKASAAQKPVWAHGRLFAIENTDSCRAGGIIAVDLHVGGVLWRASFGGYGNLCADSNSVYGVSGSEDGTATLAAFNASDGGLRWTHVSAKTIRGATATLADVGNALCLTHGNAVEYVAKKSGLSIWRRTIRSGASVGKPTIGSGGIVVAAGNDVYCLTPGNTIVWKQSFGKSMSSLEQPRVLCSDGLVFIAHRGVDGSGTLLCLDQNDGSVRWRNDNQACGHLLAEAGRLYVRSSSVRAFDEKSGAMLWSYRAGGCAPLSSDGSTLYVSESSDGGALVSLDERNGTVLGRNPSMGSCSGVVVAGGLMVINSTQGVLYAIRGNEALPVKQNT